MAKPKQKYNVYIRRTVHDYLDPNCDVCREAFAGTTWAVSAAQAETNVRYRNGDKFNFDCDDYGEMWYEAVLASEDAPAFHEGYVSWQYA